MIYSNRWDIIRIMYGIGWKVTGFCFSCWFLLLGLTVTVLTVSATNFAAQVLVVGAVSVVASNSAPAITFKINSLN